LLDIGCGYEAGWALFFLGFTFYFDFPPAGNDAISLGPLISLQAHVLLISLMEQKQQLVLLDGNLFIGLGLIIIGSLKDGEVFFRVFSSHGWTAE
jgi:hypothetical protein